MSGSRPSTVQSRLVSSAGESLSRARSLLLQPAPLNLDMARTFLASAIAQVTDLQSAVAESPNRDLTPAVLGLRQDVHLISRLLEHAASYHASLIHCMIEAASPHIAQHASPEPVRCISVDA